MLSKHPPYNPVPYQGKLTVANLITDVTRAAGVEGDGAAYPDSSVGVWPAATNIVTNGGFETNTTGWANNGSATAARSTVAAKFGAASLLVQLGNSGTTDGVNYGALSGTSLTLTNGATYTASAWVRTVTGTLALRIRAIDVTPDVLATGSVTATTTWQRVSVTFTATADNDHTIQILNNTGAASSAQFYVDGVQLETGSIATPYIETDGGTASRSAGRILGPAGVLDETRMWALVRLRSAAAYNYTTGGSNRIFQFQDSGSERLLLQHIPGDKFYLDRASGGSSGATSGALNYANGDSLTLACRFSPTAVGLSINGGAFTSAANTAIPTLSASTFDIGSNEGTGQWPGNILWFAAGLGTLTDADAALFHSWGNNAPLPHQFSKSTDLRFLAHFYGDGTAYRYRAE